MTGTSTRNQRIERFWRDVRKDVTRYYTIVLQHFTEMFDLDWTNDATAFYMHHLFLARLNADLQRYIDVWNNHSLSTEHRMSPYQICHIHRDNSFELPETVLLQADAATVPPTVDEDEYGIDENYDSEDDARERAAEMLPQVHVEAIVCPFTEDELATFTQIVEPLTLTDTCFNVMKIRIELAMHVLDAIIAQR